MADSKKRQNPRKVSPAGTAKFPRLTTPDTKFNADGEYSVKLLFAPDADGVPEFLQYLDAQANAALVEMKKENPKYAKQMKVDAPYRNEINEDGDETGMIEVAFKMPAKVTAKQGKNAGKTFEFKPALFDATGKPVEADTKIGGGSVLKVSFEHWPYFSAKDKNVGITRRMLAVQVITLVEWNSAADAATFGFGEEEGGYSAAENTAFAKTAQAASDDDDTDAGDF